MTTPIQYLLSYIETTYSPPLTVTSLVAMLSSSSYVPDLKLKVDSYSVSVETLFTPILSQDFGT